MDIQVDRTQKNKSQSVSSEITQKQSGDNSTFQCRDNRFEAGAHRKLQEIANNSPRGMQSRAFHDIANKSPQAIQAAHLQAIVNDYSALNQLSVSKKENSTGLPDNLKAGIENLSGISMDDVKVHRNSDKPAQMEAHAYTQGTDIHIGPGQEKHLPHEAWHVVQQKTSRVKPTVQTEGQIYINDDAGLEDEADRMGAKALQLNVEATVRGDLSARHSQTGTATIQRSYAALNSTGMARVDQQSEEKYDQKSLEYEKGMASIILEDDVVKSIVDFLMIRVAKIVDAWAVHTSKTQAVAYEREFGWPPGDGWYGAFNMTAQNISEVLTDIGQPIRKRLKLVYNAVRNNNLSKWLKLASIELDRAAKGKAAKNWKIRTQSRSVKNGAVVSNTQNEELTPGFAHDSSLDTVIMGNLLTELTDITNRERRVHNPLFGSKRDDFGHDHFSAAVGWKPETTKANKERRYVAYQTGILPQDKNTLTKHDVPDITDEEIDQILINQGVTPTGSRRTNFKADNASKTNWGQGADDYDVELSSESAREAQSVKARLEAGISGSTDLMIHAFKNIGMDGNVLTTLRLALAGWMMITRDHSFYEVLKAAEPYGLPFNNQPGAMYEDALNLYPLTRDDFNGVLPNDAGMNDVYPASYLSIAYKDYLANALDNPGNTQTDLNNSLHTDGISSIETAALSERDSAELYRLSELVNNTVINVGDTPSIKNKQIRTIRKSAPYLYLGNTFGEWRVESMLNRLLRTHHGMKGVANNTPRMKLLEAGVPLTILDFTPPKELARLESLRNVVENATVSPLGVLDRANIDTTIAAITLPADHKAKVVNGLIKKYHGAAHLSDSDQVYASRMERMTQLEMIASMERTSGTWYSWGDHAMLNGYIAASSLRDATSNVPSAQGPGLYVARKISSSYGYGNQPGQGLLIAILNNVPTINRQNAAQMAKLRALVGPAVGDVLETSGAYKYHVIEMLLFYGANFGRLTTNKGVTLTKDISKAPEADLRREYHKLDAGAKHNFDAQAALYGVNVAGWAPVVLPIGPVLGGLPPPPT